MSPLSLRMLLPLTLLAATGVPADPACAAVASGTGNCGRGDIREGAKHAKELPVPVAGKHEGRLRIEVL